MRECDVLIIGGGPGGLAAAIYACRSKLETIVLEKASVGGQILTTSEIDNYPGFFGRNSGGLELMRKWQDHAAYFGAQIISDTVTNLQLEGNVKVIQTASGEEYHAKAVILCPGAHPRPLGVRGEKELRGKGVSYCATCDALFFEELDVVMAGNGQAAIEEALYLTKFAAKVTIVVKHPEGTLNCTPSIAEQALSHPKIKWEWNKAIEEISGEGVVEKVLLRDVRTGEISELATNGVFVFIGTNPNTEFLPSGIKLTEDGYIITNEEMETSLPGVFAAGDARHKMLRQVVTAASDGAIAAVSAQKYIEELELWQKRVVNSPVPVALLLYSPHNDDGNKLLLLLENLNKEHPQTWSLLKMNISYNRRLIAREQIKDFPALLFFKDGREIWRKEGAFAEEEIKNKVEQLLEK